MRLRAETSSSNTPESSTFIDYLFSSEVIALIAVGVSIFTWYRSRGIEERIRADADERSKLDVVFGSPFTARVEQLEGPVQDFARCIQTDTAMPSIIAGISQVQKIRHADWYFGVLSLLDSYQGAPSDDLRTALDSYWDRSSHLVDEMSNAISPDRAREVHRKLQSLADQYLADSRRRLVEHRSSITGKPSPVLAIPFLRRLSR